ncbi:tRNA pseudouridine(55) synthase TruB [Ruminococcaceae bacterium AM07-15]|nr:tRNA pseudouridine(55) synthase TruB [Ruminococcaceae bacterium AM07-15]
MYNGILLLNKEPGFTSHDAVAKLRGILRFRRIGHAGTLDPMAQGLLVMLLGKATRASEYASGAEKEYIADFILGVETDTQDTTGNVLAEAPVDVTESQLRQALSSFEGGYDQVPPMYSAIQKDGVRLYDLARKGKEVERESRFIALPLLELLSFDPPRGKLRVRCSKGTYIRTLCHDLGQRLGCGGAMSALTRVQAGDFSLEDALTLGEVEQLVKEDTLQQHILPVDRLFASLPAVTLTEEGAKRARNGAHAAQKHLLSGAIPPVDSLCRVYTPDGEFLMTGKGGLLDMGPPAIFCHKIFGE